MKKEEIYQIENLVQPAMRDNNLKRPYLLVNPLQGKHIPVSPSASFKLFQDLSDKLSEAYPNEKLFVIGFAETATAIGAALACFSNADAYYIHTTRENIPNADYLFFSESHSHATEQKLVKNTLEYFICHTDRIIFAEDEITTGNTLLQLVDLIQEKYEHLNPKFGIVSILNGMTECRLNEFLSWNLKCTYMLHLPQKDYVTSLSAYSYPDSLCYRIDPVAVCNMQTSTLPLNIENGNKTVKGYLNPRIGIKASDYLSACHHFSQVILDSFEKEFQNQKEILLLGTEEFMFPAIYCGSMIEKAYPCTLVRVHATTRSPILPSEDAAYPLYVRYELKSVYDCERTTFIYNLKHYDKVIVLHDCVNDTKIGLCHLLNALKQSNCENISIVKWEG